MKSFADAMAEHDGGSLARIFGGKSNGMRRTFAAMFRPTSFASRATCATQRWARIPLCSRLVAHVVASTAKREQFQNDIEDIVSSVLPKGLCASRRLIASSPCRMLCSALRRRRPREPARGR